MTCSVIFRVLVSQDYLLRQTSLVSSQIQVLVSHRPGRGVQDPIRTDSRSSVLPGSPLGVLPPVRLRTTGPRGCPSDLGSYSNGQRPSLPTTRQSVSETGEWTEEKVGGPRTTSRWTSESTGDRGAVSLEREVDSV